MSAGTRALMKLIEQPVIDNSNAHHHSRHDHPPVPLPSPTSPGVHHSTFKVRLKSQYFTASECSWSPSRWLSQHIIFFCSWTGWWTENDLSAVLLLDRKVNFSCCYGWSAWALRGQMIQSLENSLFACKERCNISIMTQIAGDLIWKSDWFFVVCGANLIGLM